MAVALVVVVVALVVHEKKIRKPLTPFSSIKQINIPFHGMFVHCVYVCVCVDSETLFFFFFLHNYDDDEIFFSSASTEKK